MQLYVTSSQKIFSIISIKGIQQLCLLFTLSLLFTYSVWAADNSSSTEDDNDRVVTVLSIDGGGVRGVIPAKILADIEERLRIKFNGHVPLTDCFDVMAGTSTGALIVLCLNAKQAGSGQPAFKAQDVLHLYKDEGQNIFPLPIWEFWQKITSLTAPTYKPENLEQLLEKKLGNRLLSETISNVIIPAYEMHGNVEHVFDSQEARVMSSKDFLMKEVARATSAAPTIFPPVKITGKARSYSFIDGGVCENNPTLLAFNKALELYPNAKNFLVVSLGTGEAPQENQSEKLEGKGQIGWVSGPLIPIFMGSNSEMVNRKMNNHAKRQTRFGGSLKYIRVQPTVTETQYALTNSRPGNLDALEALASTKVADKIADIVQQLAEHRQQKGYVLKEVIGDAFTQSLVFLLTNIFSETLNLSGKGINNEHINVINNKLNNNQVTELNLSDNKFDKSVIELISKILKNNSTIKRLSLSNNNLLSSGQVMEKWFPGTSVIYLELKSTKLNELDIHAIIRLLNKKQDLVVDLSGNIVDDDGLYNALSILKEQKRIIFNNS